MADVYSSTHMNARALRDSDRLQRILTSNDRFLQMQSNGTYTLDDVALQLARLTRQTNTLIRLLFNFVDDISDAS